MIIKKLAVPLINEKLLSQAEHVYIATGAITEGGFDFVVSRLSVRCKVDIVTGLQVPTEPKVLRRILKHFTDRVQLKIFSKNIFQANVYIFDLPFRKSVAFVGSGNLTMGGLKDNEDLFYRVSDPKEIEALKSWFTGYYEFSESITETIIHEYEHVFPGMKKREVSSKDEARDVLELTSREFSWDSIKFKNQFFQKEDYLVFGNDFRSSHDVEVADGIKKVEQKMLAVHEAIKAGLSGLKLYEAEGSKGILSSSGLQGGAQERTRAMWLSYGRSKEELKAYPSGAARTNFLSLIIIIRQKEVGVWLIARENEGSEDRAYFQMRMQEPGYKEEFFQLLQNLHARDEKKENPRSPYWIKIGGDKKPLHLLSSKELLSEFIRYDDWKLNSFVIGRDYSPGDPALSMGLIFPTVVAELRKLVRIYDHLKHRF